MRCSPFPARRWVRRLQRLTVVSAMVASGAMVLPAAADTGHVNSGEWLIPAPVIRQNHSLDCESASLQMALAAKGTDLDQEAILGQLPKDPQKAVVNGHNVVSGRNVANIVKWGDPFRAFVGDPDGSERDATGYGVYWPPIADVARRAGHDVIAGEGIDPALLYTHIVAGDPAVVWLPWNLVHRPVWTWTAWDGRQIFWNHGEHTMTLVGVDFVHDTVTLNDPDAPADTATGTGSYAGSSRTISRAEFESLFQEFHQMAVIVE